MANIKNFEPHMKRLEEIVSLLESGEESLDKSLSAYSEAAKLIKECSSILDTAEEKVKILSRASDNTPVIDTFHEADTFSAVAKAEEDE